MKNGDNAFAAYRRNVDYWIVFIHIVRGRPGGLLQFSKWEAVKIFLASVSSGIRAMWPNSEKRRAWTIDERRTSEWVRKQWAALALCATELHTLSPTSVSREPNTSQLQPDAASAAAAAVLRLIEAVGVFLVFSDGYYCLSSRHSGRLAAFSLLTLYLIYVSVVLQSVSAAGRPSTCLAECVHKSRVRYHLQNDNCAIPFDRARSVSQTQRIAELFDNKYIKAGRLAKGVTSLWTVHILP